MRGAKTDILKQSIPTLLVTFATLLGALILKALAVDECYPAAELSPAGEWFDVALGSVWGVVVAGVAIVLAAIIVTRITSRYSLSVIRSFVPMVLLVVCCFGVVLPVESPSIVVALLMVVHSTELMLMSFKRAERFSEVMRASFWLGMAVAMVPDMVYLLLFLILEWIVWQRSLREMVAGTIMLLLPLGPLSFIWWAGGREPLWFVEEWCGALTVPQLPTIDLAGVVGTLEGAAHLLLFLLIFILSLVSVVVFILGYGSMRLRARKAHTLFMVLFFVGVAMVLMGLSPALALPIMGFASVPLIHTFFVRRKGVGSAVVYVLMLALTVASVVVVVL